MPVLFYFICAVLGYLIGCPNPSYFFAKAKGFDIRTKGSYNAGAANALITMGWFQAVLTALFDMGKGFLSCLAASLIFGRQYAAVAGLFAIVGHLFPFYLKFKGGKGYAAFLGIMLFVDWRVFLAAILVTALITLLTKYIVVATFIIVPAFPIYLFLSGSTFDGAFVSAAALLIIVKHIPNIIRFINGDGVKFGEIDK